MDITLKDVEVNTGYITFECPVCGADVHVHNDDGADDGGEIYWMIRAAYHFIGTSEMDNRDRRDLCKVCGSDR